MISGLYSAATAMDVAAAKHEVSAENLAFSNVPGFRRRILTQQPFSEAMKSAGRGTNVSPLVGAASASAGSFQLDFSHGAMMQTGRALDIALEGEGFFEVEGPDGPLYTRNGAFSVSPDGRLVTQDMLAVQGVNGPINVPANVSSDAIAVSKDGRLSANGVEFGQLRTVDFPDKTVLVAAGGSLVQAPPDAAPVNSNNTVFQGFLEDSNVEQMNELINIMVTSRQFEAAQKIMGAIGDSIQKRIALER